MLLYLLYIVLQAHTRDYGVSGGGGMERVWSDLRCACASNREKELSQGRRCNGARESRVPPRHARGRDAIRDRPRPGAGTAPVPLSKWLRREPHLDLFNFLFRSSQLILKYERLYVVLNFVP